MKQLLIISMIGFACIGCNVGNAPEPMSEDQLKAALEKLPAKDQIDYINSSPLQPAMKAQRIKEIEEKTGYKYVPPTNATPPATK